MRLDGEQAVKNDMKHNYLAIIPARKGSKGIKNKNLQLIGKKPIVQYALESAKDSRKLDSIVVSSDDRKILRLARALEIGIALPRPLRLALDQTPMTSVIKHVLRWYKQEFERYPENVVLLQPTSPFRTGKDIDDALRTYETRACTSLVSVCEVSQHPAECVSMEPDGTLRLLRINAAQMATRRQQYRPFYFVDGSIYVFDVSRFLATGAVLDSSSHIHIQPKSHSIDIDDTYTLSLARAMVYYAEHKDASLFKL
jgi:CMP-N,N'-diacetyllegionaminic acid synthase